MFHYSEKKKYYYFVKSPETCHAMAKNFEAIIGDTNKEVILKEIEKSKEILLQDFVGRVDHIVRDQECTAFMVECMVQPEKLKKVENASGLFKFISQDALQSLRAHDIGYIYPVTLMGAKLRNILDGDFKKEVSFYISALPMEYFFRPKVFFTPEFNKKLESMQQKINQLKENNQSDYIQKVTPLLKEMNSVIQNQVVAAQHIFLKEKEKLSRNNSANKASFISKGRTMRSMVVDQPALSNKEMLQWLDDKIIPLQQSLKEAVRADEVLQNNLMQVESISRSTQDFVDACYYKFNQLTFELKLTTALRTVSLSPVS